jgi:hypothetical protein
LVEYSERWGHDIDRFAVLPAVEKIPYFDMKAADLGILPDFIEKDFWVCWTLKQLFLLEGVGTHITFKGGTSLSKCYNAVYRFSEDIDIAIERKYLEHGKSIEPAFDQSNKENDRRIKELLAASKAVIHNEILPQLRQKVGEVLGNNGQWTIDLDPADPHQQTLLFFFPVAVAKSVNDYIKPVVKIELGARADDRPAQSVQILPYVADVLRDPLAVQPVTVKVLSAERTFWEKAMILHRLYHSPEEKAVAQRMSRHYYDLYEMGQAGIFEKALAEVELMQSVVDFNRLFYKYSWLNYDEAKRGSFRLVPKNAERLKALKADYRQMEPMFFKATPTLDEIISGLQDMEDRINNV